MSFKYIYIYIFIIVNIFGCIKKYVISSRSANLSEGTYEYFKKTFFKGWSSERDILENIKSRYVKSAIAVSYGMEKDFNFRDFLHIERRGRIVAAGATYYKELYNEDYESSKAFPKLLDRYDIQIDFKKAVQSILQNIEKDAGLPILKISSGKIFIGKKKFGKISLNKLESLLLNREYTELLSYDPEPMEGALRQTFEYYLLSLLEEDFRKKTESDLNELTAWEHSQVADLFLSMKYAKVEKGIYPGKPIEIKFTPQERFNYFAKIMYKFQDIEFMKIRFAIFKEKDDAKNFKEELKQSKSFNDLVKKFPKILESGELQTPGFDAKLGMEFQHNRPLKELVALELARNNNYEPEIRSMRDSFLVIQLLDVKRTEIALKYENYTDQVEYELRKEMLGKQYEQDKKDMEDDMQIKFYRGEPNESK